MATRRNVTSSPASHSHGRGSDHDERPSAIQPAASGKSDLAPAVPMSVVVKLLAFSGAMFGGPLAAYYVSLNAVVKGEVGSGDAAARTRWDAVAEADAGGGMGGFGGIGNSTFAGAMAALVANVVLVAYVVVAMRDDRSERAGAVVDVVGSSKKAL
ncbi:MAG: vacuolar ATPase assembly integral membrane protein vma21 [Phylliscum demangeonii]|nr:MAG: vacuolar ATPase assembly integral membrane protein vma21 [Phylliscum demangeonii]